MVSRTLMYGLVLSFGALVLSNLEAATDDKKVDAPVKSGTWCKKDAELKIEFAENGVMKIVPHGDSAVLGIVCDYTSEKKGVIKAKVTGYQGKEEAKKRVQEHLPVGLEFTFNWKEKADVAHLEEVKGDKLPDQLKTHIEGAFEKK